jgi:cytochrome c oxidase subunit 3
MITGWLRDVITESLSGLYSKQMDRTFRLGMIWFIFSEICFFAAFFGAFFYIRYYIVPFLGGVGSHNPTTHYYLYDHFIATWPLLVPPIAEKYQLAISAMGPWGLPALNTLILLTSGLTITISHWALSRHQHRKSAFFLGLTVALGVLFLLLQVYEYHHAAIDLNLTLNSGVYGSTFYLLTGFHGFHVTIGTIMLAVVLIRVLKGHFAGENHFAFEAVAWYWHFVDVVWLFLFLFVYLF